MQVKYPALLLTLLIILTAVSTGSIGGTVAYSTGFNTPAAYPPDTPGSSHFSATDGNAQGYNIAIDRDIVAFEASSEDRVHRTSYMSRARDKIGLNENRNAILQFIRDDPGSTLYDISKSLGINLGTARYHLMILDINHRVAAYHDGAKRIRYFTNNGSFSQDQMKVISLLKREPTSRLLGALAGKDGLSNAQITVKSGLSYSDVNRYLKELMAKGVVVRESLGREKYMYRIAQGLEAQIAANF